MSQRLLLKLSGESLGQNLQQGLPQGLVPLAVQIQAKEIASLLQEKKDLQLAIVLGGGNLWRGSRDFGKQLPRISSDQIGMMATIMNAIALASQLKEEGVETVHLCSFAIDGIASAFQADSAIEALEKGRVLLFSGGTGLPFFSTDTTSALRAAQIGAREILKATQVDGIYEKDPKKFPGAKRFDRLTYREALAMELEVMDRTAFALCEQNSIAIRVFQNEEGALLRACTNPNFGSRLY